MKKKYYPYPTRDPIKNYYPMPNEAMTLGLCAGEIAVLNYLMYKEDRQTFECTVKYCDIGKAVKMSDNTVRKYVRMLEEKKFFWTEQTVLVTDEGEFRNGCLKYHIRPFQEPVDKDMERQFDAADEKMEKDKAKKKAKKLGVTIMSDDESA